MPAEHCSSRKFTHFDLHPHFWHSQVTQISQEVRHPLLKQTNKQIHNTVFAKIPLKEFIGDFLPAMSQDGEKLLPTLNKKIRVNSDRSCQFKAVFPKKSPWEAQVV